MFRWEHLLAPEKVRQIQSDFDDIYEDLITGSSDEGDNEHDRAVLEEYMAEGPFSERPVTGTDDEGATDDAKRESAHGSGPSKAEPEEYDPTTSTELVAFRWRAYKPSSSAVSFFANTNSTSNAASRVFMYSCFDEDGSMEYHLHRLNCKPKRLVQLMQDVRRCSLTRNVRQAYFAITRHGGRKKAISSSGL